LKTYNIYYMVPRASSSF